MVGTRMPCEPLSLHYYSQQHHNINIVQSVHCITILNFKGIVMFYGRTLPSVSDCWNFRKQSFYLNGGNEGHEHETP